MTSSGFLHCHLHTDRSLFDGTIKVSDLVENAKSYSLKALCATDHGNIAIVPKLWKACKDNKLKPIFGFEAYIVPDKTLKERPYNHLIILAKNKIGFQNLIILSTLSSQYFYYKPRIDFNDLKKYGEGLIITTACIGGVAAPALGEKGQAGLHELRLKYFDLFKDDFYIEIQPFLSQIQRKFNEGVIKYANEYANVKLIATGDCHYFRKEDRNFHEHYIRSKTNNDKNKVWKYPYEGPYHVRNRDEMIEQFATLHGYDVSVVSKYREALDAPDEICDKVEMFDLKEGIKIPKFL